MRTNLPSVVLALCVAVTTGASAQGLRAVRPLDGWACMKLNLTEQQSLDPSVHVIVRAAPSATAAQAGWAAMTVAVRSPIQEVNGYQEMLFPNGKHTWIATKDIVPWSSLSDPTARCVPSMMSNGKPGFAYPH
jgi:hypothetical protein